MVLLRHKLGFEVKLYTSIGSHLLAEVSDSFFKRQFGAESILIDNGMFHLLRHNKFMDHKLLVKYGAKNLKKQLDLIRRRDVEILIVIPDYPFDKRLNYECYRLFRQHYPHFFKNHKTIYVLHGYWEAIIDGVDVDLVAVPFNTLSDVPIKDLRGVKVHKLDSMIIKYILARTIEHSKTHGYDAIHVLGATGRTIKKIFKPVSKITTFDGTVLSSDFIRHIVSLDSTSFHLAPTKSVRKIDYGKGLYMLPSRVDEVELKWLERWLESLQWFKVIKI